VKQPSLLPGPFLVRLVLWVALLLVFPLPQGVAALSFRIEVLGDITIAAALPPESELGKLQKKAPAQITEGILQYLAKAEKEENNPWFRDDIRIAWITTRWSQHGVPDWCLRRGFSPYVAATYQVLHCAPEEVWPNIEAARRAKLGSLYSEFWGEASSPRKPVQSVKLGAVRKADLRRSGAA